MTEIQIKIHKIIELSKKIYNKQIISSDLNILLGENVKLSIGYKGYVLYIFFKYYEINKYEFLNPEKIQTTLDFPLEQFVAFNSKKNSIYLEDNDGCIKTIYFVKG